MNFEIHNTARGAEAEVVADGALTYNGDETELGLTISEQLIQLMQGRIDIQSLAGEGTISRFDICLGYVPDSEVAATSLPLQQMSVLYVDSSELNGHLFCEQFASWGMAPAKATDASSAISVLSTAAQQENVLPLVMIRHDLPTLDGYALCHDIRSCEAIAATKILLLTVADNAATPLESDVAPFDSSLTFPIHATALHDALLQVLSSPVEAVITHEERFLQPAEQDPSNAALNILLVKDNRVNQQVALSMLKKWGHHIDVAWNGLETLEAVQRQDYDLILMDIQMPEMDGVTATQCIRQLDGKSATVPIVAVTANAMQGDRERFLEAGIDDYIPKPIDRETFYTVVHRYTPQERPVQIESAEETTETNSASPLLGYEVLSYLMSELSGETVSELIDEYMTHSTDLLSQALVASEEEDAKNVEYAVHTLKGMSGALGAIRMVDICQHILETCRNQGTQQIGPQMNGLSGTAEETQQALQAWRSEHEDC